MYDTVDEIIDSKTAKTPKKMTDFCIEQVLTKKESQYFAKKVKKDWDLWKTKNILMHTLGTACYLEGINGFEYYKKEYTKTNKLLKKNYGKLFDIVLKYYKKRAPDSKVEYRFALPGFHIFECNKLFSLPVASVHKDLQYEQLQFNNNENIDLDNTLSFTLCLELPPTGGGLFTFEENKKSKVNYKEGYIVCHNGKTTHMIAPSPSVNDNNNYFRITLQGHGLYDKNSNTWMLYW